MKKTSRSEVVSEIRTLIGDKEHLFDTTIELTGDLGSKHQIDSVVSEGLFIVEGDDVTKTELVHFDDVMHLEDLQLVLIVLAEELAN